LRRNSKEELEVKELQKLLQKQKDELGRLDSSFYRIVECFFSILTKAMDEKAGELREERKRLHEEREEFERTCLSNSELPAHPENMVKLDWKDPNYLYDAEFQHIDPEKPFENIE
jgi:hypothetical protein